MYKVEILEMGSECYALRKSKNGKRLVLENLRSGEVRVARTERYFEKAFLTDNLENFIVETHYFEDGIRGYKNFVKEEFRRVY